MQKQTHKLQLLGVFTEVLQTTVFKLPKKRNLEGLNRVILQSLCGKVCFPCSLEVIKKGAGALLSWNHIYWLWFKGMSSLQKV